MVKVRIYVEGGGNKKDLKTKCREGFRKFFEKTDLKGHMPRLIACGGRDDAYDDFCTALNDAGADELILLLVDSEIPIESAVDPWEPMCSAEGGSWNKPNGADAENLHLMVQCMEAWFLADKETLRHYYRQGFRENALPGNRAIEKIRKEDLLRSLQDATKTTSKGAYSKGVHSFVILGLIEPSKVRNASAYADRLIKFLLEKLC